MMRRSPLSGVPAFAVLLATAVLGAGCSSTTTAGTTSTSRAPGSAQSTPDQLPVAASFYPLQWVAQRLGGQDVQIVGLTPAGTEPHDLVLDPRSRQRLQDAAVVLYLGRSFQPDVERAVAQLPRQAIALDLLEAPGAELLPAPGDLGKEPLESGQDPHVWLDPVRLSALAAHAASALVSARPALGDAVRGRLTGLQSDLAGLDEQLRSRLADCAQRTIVTSHAAFGYLADRYQLTQVAIAGLSPDAEPDPATLRQVAVAAQAAGARTVFFEEALPPDLAETVAREIGADTDLLGALEFDPEGAIGPGEDYLSVMRRNGAALASGLGCR